VSRRDSVDEKLQTEGEEILRASFYGFTPTAKILPSTFNVSVSESVERCPQTVTQKKCDLILKMPVPASESADGLQTPEVFSQNELYGLFDSKMDPTFGPDFLASFAGESTSTTMPRGSDLGANPSSKFDLEPTTDINLDVKASASSNSPPNFNVDDLLNFIDGDCALPLSSQEMNSLCNTADVDADCSDIRFPVEEQCDSSAPVCGAPSASSSSSVWFDGNAKNTAVHQPVTDKYSQFDVNRAVHKTAETGENKPDIVQSAWFQSAASVDNDAAPITAEELNNAHFIFVSGNNDDPDLNQFVTIDPSLIQLGNGDPNNNGAAFIPLPVEQAAELASNSPADASTSSDAFITIDVPKREADLDAEMDAADTTTSAAAPSTSHGAKKRKSAPAPSVADEGDDDSLADGDSLDYKEKRRRNNIAVRKSRALAKEKQKNTEAENEMLRMDNEKKSREIEILQREIKIYKELFEKSGFGLPRK